MRHDCLLLSGYNWLAALLIGPHHLVLDWLSSLWWFSFPLHSPNLLLVLTREKGWLLGCWIQTSPGEVVWSPLFGDSLFSMGLLLPLDLWLLLWGWWEKPPPHMCMWQWLLVTARSLRAAPCCLRVCMRLAWPPLYLFPKGPGPGLVVRLTSPARMWTES